MNPLEIALTKMVQWFCNSYIPLNKENAFVAHFFSAPFVSKVIVVEIHDAFWVFEKIPGNDSIEGDSPYTCP